MPSPETEETPRDPRRDPACDDVVERRQDNPAAVDSRRVLRVYQDTDGSVQVTYKQPMGLPRTCRQDAWRRWARNGVVLIAGDCP